MYAPEDDVEVQAEGVVDGLCVVEAKFMQLVACDVGAGVHEERGLAPALERELAELEHVGIDHEVDELLLIGFHDCPRLP